MMSSPQKKALNWNQKYLIGQPVRLKFPVGSNAPQMDVETSTITNAYVRDDEPCVSIAGIDGSIPLKLLKPLTECRVVVTGKIGGRTMRVIDNVKYPVKGDRTPYDVAQGVLRNFCKVNKLPIQNFKCEAVWC